jgi:hypothetical protein
MAADGVSATGHSPRLLLGLAHWVSAFLVLCALRVILSINYLANELTNLSLAATGLPVATMGRDPQGRVPGLDARVGPKTP